MAHRICNAIYYPRAEVQLKHSIARGTNSAKARKLKQSNEIDKMKKTLITLLALGSMAMGATYQVLDLKSQITADDSLPYLYDGAGVFTNNGSQKALSYSGSGMEQTHISFTLNLTSASNAVAAGDTAISLVAYDMDNMDIGLYLTSTGIGFGKASNSLQGTEETYSELFNNKESFVGNDGNKYITLTFATRANDGIYLFDNGGNFSTATDTALIKNGYKNNPANTTVSSLSINTEHIVAIQLANSWPTNGKFGEDNAKLDTVMRSKLVPEPATATLSLLALAGLAARRRRR